MARPLDNITDHWNPRDEARAFVALVVSGVATPEDAEDDILMSPETLAWLVRRLPEEAELLQRIYERRQETYACFRRTIERGRHGNAENLSNV